jgi:hypothetical protein
MTGASTPTAGWITAVVTPILGSLFLVALTKFSLNAPYSQVMRFAATDAERGQPQSKDGHE